jgi:transcriptional regulator with XRE-family HTH domain
VAPRETKIRAARKRAGLTRLQLAEASGLAYGTVCRLEAGNDSRPNIHTLSKLAEALGVAPCLLLPDPEPVAAARGNRGRGRSTNRPRP